MQALFGVYLVEEVEKVQNRSLSFIGVPSDSYEKLGIRRIETTNRELQLISNEENHPCFKLSTDNINRCSLGSGSIKKLAVPLSGNKIHKHSVLPRSLRVL